MNIKALALSIFVLSMIDAQGQESVKYQNTIGADLISFSYARSFVVKERWAFGTEVSHGIWGARYAFTPLKYTYCEQGCTKHETRFIGEMFKIKPFVRINYYNTNYVDIGINISYTMLRPIFLDNYGGSTLNYAAGLDVVIVYGWERIKLGTGFQANIIGKYDTKVEDKVSDQQFAVLWTPIKVNILF